MISFPTRGEIRHTACEVLYRTALLGPAPLFRHLPSALTIPFTFRAYAHTCTVYPRGSMSCARAYIHTVQPLARCRNATLPHGRQRTRLSRPARAITAAVKAGEGKVDCLGRPTRTSSSRREVALRLRAARCTSRNTHSWPSDKITGAKYRQ